MNFFDKNLDRLTEDATAARKRTKPAPSPLDGKQRLQNAASIDLDRIEADPQHREHFDEQELENLAQSLRDHGQLQPVKVRWDDSRGKYVIIAGERRFRAAQRAALSSIDCIIHEGELTSAEIITQQIIENAHREDLRSTERAKAFRDLMKLNDWNGKQLAAELHIHPSTVSRTLRLLELDENDQRRVDEGVMTEKEALRQLITPQPAAALENPKRKGRGARQRKIVTTVGTITLKARRIITDELFEQALSEALQLAAETPENALDHAA